MRPRRPEPGAMRPARSGGAGARSALRSFLVGLAALVLLPGCGQAEVERELPRSRQEVQLSFAPIVREATPAVVNIASRRAARGPASDPFLGDPFFRFFFEDFGLRPPQRRMQSSLGSGVIVASDGLIVTNHHVVQGADQITVVLADRREFEARVVGADAASDLALLRVDVGREPLPALELGDSDALEVGDLVLAIGNPFGIGQTVTGGIVSALGRSTPQTGSDIAFIQTDAAINPGNSGGPLVGLDGRVVGINTAIFTRGGGSIGIGFAVPANLVRAMIQSAARHDGRFERPWLGAQMQPVDGDLAQGLGLDRPGGALVARVHPDGPAARAGLVPGDVIQAVDGHEIHEPTALGYRLAVRTPGEEVALSIEREGRRLELSAPVELPPREPSPDPTRLGASHPLAGLVVANLSPGFAGEHGLDPFVRGVIVLEVARGSRGHRMGLRPGDVIIAVEGREITRIDELDQAFAASNGPLRLNIQRDGRTARLVVGA